MTPEELINWQKFIDAAAEANARMKLGLEGGQVFLPVESHKGPQSPKSKILCWHFWWFSTTEPYFAHVAIGALGHSTLEGARMQAMVQSEVLLGEGDLVSDPEGKPLPWDRPPGIYMIEWEPEEKDEEEEDSS